MQCVLRQLYVGPLQSSTRVWHFVGFVHCTEPYRPVHLCIALGPCTCSNINPILAFCPIHASICVLVACEDGDAGPRRIYRMYANRSLTPRAPQFIYDDKVERNGLPPPRTPKLMKAMLVCRRRPHHTTYGKFHASALGDVQHTRVPSNEASIRLCTYSHKLRPPDTLWLYSHTLTRAKRRTQFFTRSQQSIQRAANPVRPRKDKLKTAPWCVIPTLVTRRQQSQSQCLECRQYISENKKYSLSQTLGKRKHRNRHFAVVPRASLLRTSIGPGPFNDTVVPRFHRSPDRSRVPRTPL